MSNDVESDVEAFVRWVHALRAERNAAIAERDRLWRELEALRDEMTGRVEAHHLASMRVASDRMYASRAEARGRRSEAQYVSGRLNTILRGES